MPKELQAQLIGLLDRAFIVTRHKKSHRTLILKEVGKDLELGFIVQKYTKRRTSVDLVDIGARIPSVECFYDKYEVDGMRQMGFKDLEPIGWLTFWRPTYSSAKLEEEGLSVDAIVRDFSRLYDSIVADVERSRREMVDLLSEARRPDWATLPSSSLLVIKALAFRATRESDACIHANRLISQVPDITPYYIQNVETFCRWLRSKSPMS